MEADGGSVDGPAEMGDGKMSTIALKGTLFGFERADLRTYASVDGFNQWLYQVQYRSIAAALAQCGVCMYVQTLLKLRNRRIQDLVIKIVYRYLHVSSQYEYSTGTVLRRRLCSTPTQCYADD